MMCCGSSHTDYCRLVSVFQLHCLGMLINYPNGFRSFLLLQRKTVCLPYVTCIVRKIQYMVVAVCGRYYIEIPITFLFFAPVKSLRIASFYLQVCVRFCFFVFLCRG